MEKRSLFPMQYISKKTALVIAIAGVLAIMMMTLIRFNITRNFEGIFLLKGVQGALFEVKDDVLLGEGSRYIAGIDIEDAKLYLYRLFHSPALKEPYLYFEWNEKKGEGFVRNYFPGGKQMITNFSRSIDDSGKESSGLFIGGGLPANVLDDDTVKENETGMAYYNGRRWLHIWCNVNEGILNSKFKNSYPSSWKFLGSEVLHQNETDLILESVHELLVDNIPLHVERHAYFRAGETYFALTVSITNIGNDPVTYSYFYGDEPWLGNYGSSAGNVGWSADGLYNYVSVVDTKRTNYAGFFDYGNDAIGEGHNFTLAANFIQWFSDVEPFVYFSNGPYETPNRGNLRTPLKSNTRFIGIQWGPRILRPGQSEIYTMAIGMARLDGLPVKPDIDLRNFP
jgi:hypothetical protein